MAPAAEPKDDLSVRLSWPIDPLAAEPIGDVSDEPPVDIDDQLDALAATSATVEEHADLHAAVEAMAAHVDRVTTDMIKVLRTLNTSLRRTRDQTVAGLDESIEKLREDMGAFRAEVTSLLDEKATQRTTFGDELTTELKAWRRKLPTKGPTGGEISEPAMEELVNRLADEMEIRIFAALKKSGVTKKR